MRRRGFNREGLAALLPVLDGREGETEAGLAAMPGGPASPFARIGSTHFARLVLVAGFPDRREGGETLPDLPACLFFAAEFDIPVAGYLEALCAVMPDEADAVFAACAGYPGARVPPVFADWMLHHRVKAGFSLHANPQASVHQVLDALRLRERIIAFALETRALAPADLKAAWSARDWGNVA